MPTGGGWSGLVQVADELTVDFECAIHRMAPTCEHCGCRMIGHGVHAAGRFFCCRHCADTAVAGRRPSRAPE
ncbi:hypothetical protein [Pseudonocardia endophytica]|uniref:hypothetical protein n=1 Tax=Pseudonocardia endophytica TaxID=401976 RepID=UPI003C72369A